MRRIFTRKTAIGVGLVAFGAAVYAVGRYAQELGAEIDPVGEVAADEEPDE